MVVADLVSRMTVFGNLMILNDLHRSLFNGRTYKIKYVTSNSAILFILLYRVSTMTVKAFQELRRKKSRLSTCV